MSQTVFLVAVEGLDGVGKSTTTRLLARSLSEAGHTVVRRHFEKSYLRRAYTEARRSGDIDLKYSVQITGALLLDQEISRVTLPTIYICDRYIHSARTYHRLISGKDLVPNIERLVRRPDLFVLLECSPSERRKRLLKRRPAPSERKLFTTTPRFTMRYLNLLGRDEGWFNLNTETLSHGQVVRTLANELEGRLWRS